MSVLIETSLGELVIDTLVDEAPKAAENFLKLCKVKYYNFSPFHTIQKEFSCQTGDPLGPDAPGSDGGSSIWGLLQGSSRRTFPLRIDPKLKHGARGTVSMATVPSDRDADERLAGSQFLITLGDNIDSLDGKAIIFGRVVEGLDTLDKINRSLTSTTGRPLKDIRIKHTIVLDDPFDDPAGLIEPQQSPPPTKAQLDTVMIADDEELEDDMDEAALEKLRKEREARAQALTLEMVGDLPFAEVKPPENVLFVCRLNPVTQDEDLQLIFSRFGTIASCEVIRDKRTGDSLQYAFIEFEDQKDCEQAYLKMQDVLIDDHRIHVDFSQSVSKSFNAWRDSSNLQRRQQQGGGFGGIENLQKKRHYREQADRSTGQGYRMVFESGRAGSREEGRSTRGVQSRSRSRSPRHRQGDHGRDRDYGDGQRRARGRAEQHRDDGRYGRRRRD